MRSLHRSLPLLVILMFISPLEFSRAQQVIKLVAMSHPHNLDSSSFGPPQVPSLPPPPSSQPPTPCYQCNLPNTCSCSYQITNYVSCRLSEIRSQLISSQNEINKQLNCLRAGGRVCALNNLCYAVRTVPRIFSAARSSCSNLRGYIVSTYTVSPNVAERCMDLEEDGQYWVSGSYNSANCPAVIVNSDHSLSSNRTSCSTKLPYICQIWI